MPAKEIKELRQSGKLQEAYDMARAELDANQEDIWAKRNISWVHYEFLKANSKVAGYTTFIEHLRALRQLQLPVDEKMLFDNACWQIGKMPFAIQKEQHPDHGMVLAIWEEVKDFSFTKPSEAYSFLFKAFHKSFKESSHYLAFADCWDLKNLRNEDYQKEKMPNGKEVMSVAEQAIIAYCKHLLPTHELTGEVIFDKEKVEAFMPFLDEVIESHHDYQYPAYFKAKLLLAMGDQEHMLSALLPFAKRKRNDFWVWEVMSEAFPHDDEKRLACYCRGLTCSAQEDFLINLRQKLAHFLVGKQLYDEAKAEIELLLQTRKGHGWKIPNEVQEWTNKTWYQTTKAKQSNQNLYAKYAPIADDLLYADIPEETVIIEFVNKDRQIANFIATDTNYGFFKYDRFFKHLQIGDVLKVRFNGSASEGLFKLNTASKVNDEAVRQQFVKSFEGPIRIADGKSFGFVEDIYVHPNLVKRFNLQNQQPVKGKSIKSFNQEKKQWGWKVYELETA